MRARWEAVPLERRVAFGPPNWMVKERTRQGEAHIDAFHRVYDEIIAEQQFPNTELTNSNKRTRGRPRQWASDAERMRARRNGNAPG